VHKIVELCSLTNYSFLSDFEWYISVLIELTRVRGMASGKLVAAQFTNVAVRVPSVRAAAAQQLAALLAERRLLVGNVRRGGPCEALAAAAFVCGEYASDVEHPASVIGSLLQAGAVTLPGHVQSAYVQAALKLFAHIVSKDGGAGESLANSMREQLAVFAESQHLEVQERACFARELLALFGELRGSDADRRRRARLALLQPSSSSRSPPSRSARCRVRPASTSTRASARQFRTRRRRRLAPAPTTTTTLATWAPTAAATTARAATTTLATPTTRTARWRPRRRAASPSSAAPSAPPTRSFWAAATASRAAAASRWSTTTALPLSRSTRPMSVSTSSVRRARSAVSASSAAPSR
jgi:hypothetical protein